MEKTKLEEERKVKKVKKEIEKVKSEVMDEKKMRDAIRIGSLVKLRNTKQTGKVLELNKTEATVAFGVFKTKVDISRLEWIV